MHVKAKAAAFGGLSVALSIVCMSLGSIIESNTLFLLAAASYFVGIMIREFGIRAGAAFYAADVLLGMLIAPNKFYVLSYAAMGLYILLIEIAWQAMARGSHRIQKRWVFWVLKYLIFNVLFLPVLFLFQDFFFAGHLTGGWLAGVILAAQFALWIYDRAYEYVQRYLWDKYRRRILG